MFVVVHFSFDTMKSQLKKLAQKSGKLTLVEAGVLFVSCAVSTYLVCKALDKK